MHVRFDRLATAVLAGLIFAGFNASHAQSNGSPPPPAPVASLSLAELSQKLPEYLQADKLPAYAESIDNATVEQRDAALPALMKWLDDERAQVRSQALLSLYLLYLPSEKRPWPANGKALTEQYVATVAAHLRDPDPKTRLIALLALQPVLYNADNRDEVVGLVLPMLREPDVLIEYPDPDRQHQSPSPEQQARLSAHATFRLPAEGPGLLELLTTAKQSSAEVDDALIAFLDRKDQTPSTLSECLRALTQTYASERVNDEALRRVFEQKAMTPFLLQFVAQLRLTPAHLAEQKERLLALANDPAERASLRHAAKHVAACWSAQSTMRCQPDSEDINDYGTEDKPRQP